MVSLSEVSQNGAHGLFGLLTGMIRTSARRHSVFAEWFKDLKPEYVKKITLSITCLILVPVIEPLTSMTNMTSLGTTGSPLGAK